MPLNNMNPTSVIAKSMRIFSQARNFLLFSLVSVIGNVLTAFSPLLVAKVLNPEGFGSYSLSMGFVFLFCSILINSSQAPCIIFTNQELEKSQKANRSFTLLLIVTTSAVFVSGLVLFLSQDVVTTFTKSGSSHIWVSMFAAFGGYALKSFSQNVLLGFNNKKLSAFVEVLFGSIGLLSIGILYFTSSISVFTVLVSYLVAGVCTLLIPLFAIKKHQLFPLILDISLLKRLFHFTKWQLVGLTAIYLVNWGDNLVLRLFVDIQQIGIYNLAYKLFSGIATIIFFVNIYFLPLLSKQADKPEFLKDYLQQKRPKIFLVLCAGVVAAFAIMPILMRFVYGADFQAAGNIFRILCIGLVLQSIYVFYIPFLNVLNRYKFIQLASVIQIVVNLGLDFILVPKFGIQGAAIATVIGYASLALTYEVYVRKQLGTYLTRE